MANQILGQEKNSILGNGGSTQPQEPQLVVSKLHNEYSINNNPHLNGKPSPSKLDELDINNTSKYTSAAGRKYTDNLPK